MIEKKSINLFFKMEENVGDIQYTTNIRYTYIRYKILLKCLFKFLQRVFQDA